MTKYVDIWSMPLFLPFTKKSLVLTVFLMVGVSVGQAQNPVATRGVIDLSASDLSQNQSISLDGDWLFYWEEFIDTVQIPQTDTQIPVPSQWITQEISVNDTIFQVPRRGFASYYLQVILPPNVTFPLSMELGLTGSAYKLYLDGELKVSSGTISKQKEGFYALEQRRMIDIGIPQSDTLHLVVHAASFNLSSGIRQSWKIGNTSSVNSKWEKKYIQTIISMTAFLVMGMYHFILFLQRRKDKAILYFAATCVLVIVRTLSVEELLILELIPTIHSELIYKLEYLSFYLGVLAFGTFVKEIFKNEFSLTINKVTNALAILSSILVCLFSYNVFIHTLVPMQLLSLFSLIYILFVNYKAIRNKVSGSKLFFIGISSIIVSAGYDILMSISLTSYHPIIQYGFIIFVFAQVVILARRFANSLTSTEVLSEQLKYTNENLEKLVEDRTQSLQVANEELRLQKENLEKLNSTKSKFFSIISHDLRNPMGALVGFNDLIKRHIESAYDVKNDEQLNQLSGYLTNAAQQVNTLLDNLLKWALKEEGVMPYDPENIEVAAILKGTVDVLQPQANAKHIKLSYKVSEPMELMLDKNSILTTLRNITSNAIKFSPEGESVSLEAKRKGKEVRICISDNGVGIPKENIDKLFDLTRDKLTKGTKGEKGTGLGLNLVHDFVRLNKGKINVESKLGEGTTFTLLFPLNN